MAKEQKIEIGIINIVTHPHSPENYADLWMSAVNLQRAVKVLGDTFGVIRTAFRIDPERPEKGITGDIYRFTNIDLNKEWFDMEKGEHVDAEELEGQVSIPENLKPNSHRIRYVFFPELHRLVFTTKLDDGTLSPKMAATLVKQTLGDQRLADKAPNLEVTPEQSREQLEEIFSSLMLTRLQITIKVPNGDEDGAFYETLEESLEEERAEKLVEIKYAKKRESLKPNARTLQMAEVAMSNGSVEGDGINAEGDRKQFNTQDHPIRRVEYVPVQVAFASWFVDTARSILKDVLKR